MFAYIKGSLEEVYPQIVILEAGGIGYEIKLAASTIPRLPEKGSFVKLYTYLNVREDVQELYGFYDREEKNMFEKLITVSGIGPKVAMGVLSALSPSQIALAIVTDDIKTLCIAPGVGKKTAQRMILDLKEKMDKEALVHTSGTTSNSVFSEDHHEVIQALTALGYQPAEAMKALNSIEDQNQDISTLIKLSLKLMDKG